MITVGLVRVGNEPVVRYLADGKPVLDLNLAYNYGRKGQDGMYPTQWVYATMFGERVEKLAPHIRKGSQLVVELSDMYLDNYTKKDGSAGSSIKARLTNLTLVSEPKREEKHSIYADDEPPF